MTGYEIIILAAGLVFVVASFCFGGKKEALETVDVNAEIRKIKEAAVLQENEVSERVKKFVESECDTALTDAQEALSKISNDKIIAIDEYASQVLERIENNNQAVVFLYDMLQKKDDEMKSTMNKMEQTRRENKELFDRLEELKQAKARVSSRAAVKAGAKNAQPASGGSPAAGLGAVTGMSRAGAVDVPSIENDIGSASGSDTAVRPTEQLVTGRQTAAMVSERQTVMRNEMPQGGLELEHTQAGALELLAQHQEMEEALAGAEDISFDTAEERRERILAMYQENKSVKEISKQLSMGQGEVKFIIDLYAKKSK